MASRDSIADVETGLCNFWDLSGHAAAAPVKPGLYAVMNRQEWSTNRHSTSSGHDKAKLWHNFSCTSSNTNV